LRHSGDMREFVQRVRQATDIVEVISEHLTLRRRGQRYFGLCPFHDERSPSFSVSPDKQLFYCFGCHEGGDVYDFVMKKEGMEFREALEYLARRAGIPMPETRQTPAQKKRTRERQRLLEVIKLAARYYQYVLLKTPQGESARRYLEGRGVSPEMIDTFGLGYAPDSWTALFNALNKRGYSGDVLERAGLVSLRRDGSGYYDRFRDRVMFPIRDLTGRVIAFGGRILSEGEPKYLNSPETPVFSKRHTWYGLDAAKGVIRKKERALVMEGYMDVLTAHQFGFDEAVASLGTALSPEQAKRLVRFASSVVIAYDADAAGSDATFRGLELFEQLGCAVRVMRLPEGFDPDDVLRQKGQEYFLGLLEESPPLIEYQFEVAMETSDVSTVEGRVKVVEAVAPWLARLDNAVARTSYMQLFAERLGIDEESLRREVSRNSQGMEGASGQHRLSVSRHNITGNRGTQVLDAANQPVPAYVKAEKLLLRLMLRNLTYLRRIRELLSEDGLISTDARRIERAIYDFYQVEGRVPEVSELLGELDEEGDRQYAAALAMGEQVIDDPQRMIRDCVAQIRRRRMIERREQLRKEIVELERKGLTVSRELLQEYDGLNRTLKANLKQDE